MPLRYLFVDMNSYFASVEQELRPELRSRPVAVVPSMVNTTCCIAASYEAKSFGVKTGTAVHEAKRLCPGLRLVEARPELYVNMHHRIVEAVESCLPIASVMSIDEMSCHLLREDQLPERAVAVAQRVKQAIRERVGSYLRCSIGIGPNVLLAKVASDMQKPDGLTVIRPEDLPQRLYELKPSDFPGIGSGMERRLRNRGITSVAQLCALSRDQFAQVWGSRVLADRWWGRLRGEDIPNPPEQRRSLGHSHVLAPELRTDAGAWSVLVGLLHKAAARMRQSQAWTGSLSLSMEYWSGPGWQTGRRIDFCRDTLTLLRVMRELWSQRPLGNPFKVGLVLGHLQDDRNVASSLFEEDRQQVALSETIDRITEKFGMGAISFGQHGKRSSRLPNRISFTRIPEQGQISGTNRNLAWEPQLLEEEE